MVVLAFKVYNYSQLYFIEYAYFEKHMKHKVNGERKKLSET